MHPNASFWLRLITGTLAALVCLAEVQAAGVAEGSFPVTSIPGKALGNFQKNDVVIELYMRSDKQQSREALAFLQELAEKREGLKIKSYDLTKDKPALARLWKLSKSFGYEKPGVPTIHFCNSLKIGFNREYTAPLIEQFLTIRAFVRKGCPHCRDARLFLDKMVQRWPALRVEYHDVVVSARAREEVQKVANKYNIRIATFPCIELAGQVIIGYQTDAITGQKIESIFQDRSFQSVDMPDTTQASRPTDRFVGGPRLVWPSLLGVTHPVFGTWPSQATQKKNGSADSSTSAVQPDPGARVATIAR